MKIFIQPVINDTKICISIRQGYSMRNSEAAVVHVSWVGRLTRQSKDFLLTVFDIYSQLENEILTHCIHLWFLSFSFKV